MKRFIIDASVAVKWVVEDEGTADALAVLETHPLSSPDLLIAECANIFWKKVRLGELDEEEASLAARLIERADIEILPTRHLLERAARLAIALDHPAYDCVYLAVALERDWPFVTADVRFRGKIASSHPEYRGMILSVKEALAQA